MGENLLIYGVTGYTGKLVLAEAVAKGLRPVIAGRNAQKVEALAEQYGLKFLVFELNHIETITENLRGFKAVLHLAGPFRETARPMAEACIAAGVHYLDITGEIAIMEWMKNHDAEAKSAGIMLMCGVGFDLVPTDCVALKLKESMPDADRLKIAFYMKGGSISHGTMKTMVGNLGLPGFTRKNGALIQEPVGKKGMYFRFGSEKKFCITIPWGDLFNAYESTGIPSIETYSTASPLVWLFLKIQFLFNPILRSKWFRKMMWYYVDKKVTGPTKAQNDTGKSLVTGMVQNSSGNTRSLTIQVAESYMFTALAAVAVTKRVLQDELTPGYQTPAKCYGSDLVYGIEGTVIISPVQ